MALSGNAKTGGTGVKYTLGKPGDEVNTPSSGAGDPPADGEDVYFAQVYSSENKQFPSEVATKIVNEYFESEDISEVARSLNDAKEIHSYSEFVKYAVRSAMEKHDRERELTSRLFSYLYGSVLPSHQIAEGFRFLIDSIDDLILDNPPAVELLSKFITRAIVDEIIPPSFINRTRPRSRAGDDVLSQAGKQWNGETKAHLDQIWGPSAAGSVKKLKSSLRSLVEEYLASEDAAEADRTLRDLHVPSFHFGFVKIAVDQALEGNAASESKKLIQLLAKLRASDLLTAAQLDSGFKASLRSIVDFVKDISATADKDFLELVDGAHAAGLLSQELVNNAKVQVPALLAADKKQREESMRLLQEKAKADGEKK